jgi:predicted acyltransferase
MATAESQAHKVTAGPVRVPGVDGLRGLAVLTMAVGNLGLGVAWVPELLKHTPDVGFTVADLVAPLFVVLSAFTIGPALERRRAAQGLRAAMGWLVNRSLALMGIGAVISAGEWVFLPPPPGTDPTWGVLQAIGAASLLTSAVIVTRPRVRVAVGLAVLATYQWLLDAFWLDTVRSSIQNGLAGSLAWGGLMILSTAVADAWRATSTHRGKVVLLAGLGVLSTGTALALSLAFPIAKARASASYMLLRLGLSLLLYAVFEAAFTPRPLALLWLQRVGRRPLAMYLAHLILLAPLTLVAADALYARASPPLTLVEAALLAGILIALAHVLDRRGSPPGTASLDGAHPTAAQTGST